MKVLIVDDSEQVWRVIKTFIGDLVSEIGECSDGIDALGVYREHQLDLVLMDVKIKGMDALAATPQWPMKSRRSNWRYVLRLLRRER